MYIYIYTLRWPQQGRGKQTYPNYINEMKFVGYSLGSRGRPSDSWFSDSRVVTVSFPFRLSVSFAFRSRFVPTSSPFRSYFVPAYLPPPPPAPLLETLPRIPACRPQTKRVLGTQSDHTWNWESTLWELGTGN